MHERKFGVQVRDDLHRRIACPLLAQAHHFLYEVVELDIRWSRIGLSGKTEQLMSDLFAADALNSDLLQRLF